MRYVLDRLAPLFRRMEDVELLSRVSRDIFSKVTVPFSDPYFIKQSLTIFLHFPFPFRTRLRQW